MLEQQLEVLQVALGKVKEGDVSSAEELIADDLCFGLNDKYKECIMSKDQSVKDPFAGIMVPYEGSSGSLVPSSSNSLSSFSSSSSSSSSSLSEWASMAKGAGDFMTGIGTIAEAKAKVKVAELGHKVSENQLKKARVERQTQQDRLDHDKEEGDKNRGLAREKMGQDDRQHKEKLTQGGEQHKDKITLEREKLQADKEYKLKQLEADREDKQQQKELEKQKLEIMAKQFQPLQSQPMTSGYGMPPPFSSSFNQLAPGYWQSSTGFGQPPYTGFQPSTPVLMPFPVPSTYGNPYSGHYYPQTGVPTMHPQMPLGAQPVSSGTPYYTSSQQPYPSSSSSMPLSMGAPLQLQSEPFGTVFQESTQQQSSGYPAPTSMVRPPQPSIPILPGSLTDRGSPAMFGGGRGVPVSSPQQGLGSSSQRNYEYH